MEAKKLSAMEIDAIGEILNISLGASATAISTMLDARVDITTPVVQVKTSEEFEFGNIEPAIGVEITYIDGLSGSNIMVLKRNDVRIIVGMLMGMEIPEEDFELDEMNISAICEVMNQMMGASATALSELLGRTVNISTPVSDEIKDPEDFKDKYFSSENQMVVIGFTLKIGDKIESEFMNLMPTHLAGELVSGFFSDGVPELEEIPKQESVGAGAESAQPAQKQAETAQAEAYGQQPGAQQTEAVQSGGQEAGAYAQQPEAAQAGAYAQQPEAAQAGTYAQQPEAAAQAGTYGQQPEAMQAGAYGQQPGAMQPGAPQAEPYIQPPGGMYTQAGNGALGNLPPRQDYPAQMGGADMQVLSSMTQMMELMRKQLEMQQAQMQHMRKAEPRKIKVDPAPSANLEGDELDAGQQDTNLDLIMGVPLEVSVEIGRTKKLVKDILELNKGSLVVLDKLAGEQVDLFVNGQCIAQGDVVVVDDSFGIRITEILTDEITLPE